MWNFLCDTETKGSLGESNRQDSINQKKYFPTKLNPLKEGCRNRGSWQYDGRSRSEDNFFPIFGNHYFMTFLTLDTP
jgi:hypothetical protein